MAQEHINAIANVASEVSTNLATIAAMGDPNLASIGEGSENFSASSAAAAHMEALPTLNKDAITLETAIIGQNIHSSETIEKINSQLAHYTLINIHAS